MPEAMDYPKRLLSIVATEMNNKMFDVQLQVSFEVFRSAIMIIGLVSKILSNLSFDSLKHGISTHFHSVPIIHIIGVHLMLTLMSDLIFANFINTLCCNCQHKRQCYDYDQRKMKCGNYSSQNIVYSQNIER